MNRGPLILMSDIDYKLNLWIRSVLFIVSLASVSTLRSLLEASQRYLASSASSVSRTTSRISLPRTTVEYLELSTSSRPSRKQRTLAGGWPRSIEHWKTASFGAVAVTSLNGSSSLGRLTPGNGHDQTTYTSLLLHWLSG